MKPLFSPKDGKIDVDRLRIVFDDINPIEGYIDIVKASIKKWEKVLDVEIVNFDPGRSVESADYQILVGKGGGALEPNKSLTVSYVGPEGGYFFSPDANEEYTAIHEFGHLMGLADRYYEAYQYDDRQVEGGRGSVSMSLWEFKDKNGKIEEGEEDYDPHANIMSSSSKDWTISKNQRNFILSGKEETPRRRDVVGVFYSKGASGLFKPPDSMFLDEGQLYESPGDRKAGYSTLLSGSVCIAHVPLADTASRSNIRELWRMRGNPTRRKRKRPKRVIKGVLHRGPRISTYEEVPGERIHRKIMSDIGQLAGG